MSRPETSIIPSRPAPVTIPDEGNLRAVATDLLNSKLFPQYENVTQAMTAILAGTEMGLGPVSSLQYIAVVKGRMSVEAKVFLALFHKHGGVTSVLQRGKDKCVIKFSKPGREDYVHEYTWSMAVAEGLTGKDNWKKMPETMLFNRCVANGIRAFDPGILMGIALTVDEAEDLGGIDSPGIINVMAGKVEEVREEKRKPGRPKKEEKTSPAQEEAPIELLIPQVEEVVEPIVAEPIVVPQKEDSFEQIVNEEEDFITKLKAAIDERGVDQKRFKAWLYGYQGKTKVPRKFVVKLGSAIRFHGGDRGDQEYLLRQLDAAVSIYEAQTSKDEK